LLEVIAAKSPSTQVLFLIEPKNIRLAMSALRAGGYQYAKLPVADEELKLLIQTSIAQQPTYAPNLLVKRKSVSLQFEQMIGLFCRYISRNTGFRPIRCRNWPV